MARTSTAVETAASNLPALAHTPALDISPEDVALPRLYMGQPQSEAVQEDRVPKNCLYVAMGKDDPDPKVIWKQEDEQPGVLFHVLSLTKGKSASVNGELRSFAFNDPDAPEDAYTTYNYVLALPEVDEDVPVKFLLKGTSSSAAKQINFLLLKNAGRAPAHALAFRLWVKADSNDKGRFSVAKARQVEAKPEQVAIAEQLAVMIAGQSTETAGRSAKNDEPAI